MNDKRTLKALKDLGSGKPVPEDVALMYHQGFVQFGTRSLWNWREPDPPTITQALAIADSLRTEGDRAARARREEVATDACNATELMWRAVTMNLKFLSLAIVLQQCVMSPARAEPETPINLQALVERADAIVAAKVVGAGDGRKPNVEIDSVLKGSLDRRAPLVTELLERNFGRRKWIYGVFFLRSVPSGFEVMTMPASPHLPAYVVAAPPEYAIRVSSDDPLILTAARVASVFNVPLSAAADVTTGLAYSAMAIIDYSPYAHTGAKGEPPMHAASGVERAENVYDRALVALSAVPHNISTPILKRIIDSKLEPIRREFAVATLTFTGDTSRLSSMQYYLLRPPPDAKVAHGDLSTSIELAEFYPKQEDFFCRFRNLQAIH